jgi:hypothetical protein
MGAKSSKQKRVSSLKMLTSLAVPQSRRALPTTIDDAVLAMGKQKWRESGSFKPPNHIIRIVYGKDCFNTMPVRQYRFSAHMHDVMATLTELNGPNSDPPEWSRFVEVYNTVLEKTDRKDLALKKVEIEKPPLYV